MSLPNSVGDARIRGEETADGAFKLVSTACDSAEDCQAWLRTETPIDLRVVR